MAVFVLLSSEKTFKGCSGLLSPKVLHNDLLCLIICKQMTLKFVFINCSKSPYSTVHETLEVYQCTFAKVLICPLKHMGFWIIQYVVRFTISFPQHCKTIYKKSATSWLSSRISCTKSLCDYMFYKKTIIKY